MFSEGFKKYLERINKVSPVSHGEAIQILYEVSKKVTSEKSNHAQVMIEFFNQLSTIDKILLLKNSGKAKECYKITTKLNKKPDMDCFEFLFLGILKTSLRIDFQQFIKGVFPKITPKEAHGFIKTAP